MAVVPMPDKHFFPLYATAVGNKSAVNALFMFDRDKDVSNYCVDQELTKYGYLLNCSEWLAGVIHREKAIYRLKHALQSAEYPLCIEKDTPIIAWGVTSGTCISRKWIEYLQADNRMFIFYITYTNVDCVAHNARIPNDIRDRFVFLNYSVSKGGTWAENRNKLFMFIMTKEKTMNCLFHYHIYANNDVTPSARPDVGTHARALSGIARLHDIITTVHPFYSAPGGLGMAWAVPDVYNTGMSRRR